MVTAIFELVAAKCPIDIEPIEMGSSPVVSTKTKKSELLPCGGWVRIFAFYQGYFILNTAPAALFFTGLPVLYSL